MKMKPRHKRRNYSVRLSSGSDGRRAEPSEATIEHARRISELDECMIAYFRSERNSLSALLDLLENCHRYSKPSQQMIAQARALLARIDGPLASLALEPNVSLH
jgi:hypothetical protein